LRVRWLSLGGVLGPVLFFAAVAVLGALRPGYSHVAHFISELGASGTPHSAVMNYAGFVPAGLLLAALGVSLFRVLPRQALAIAGAALVTLFGVLIAASGIASCDPGCPQGSGSAENAVHNTIAPILFIALIVASALLGQHFRRVPPLRGLSLYSFATSLAALVLFVAMVQSLEARELTGLWQRLLLATQFAWCVVVGLRLFRFVRAAGSASSGT
jgi:hypothetical membrane protein